MFARAPGTGAKPRVSVLNPQSISQRAGPLATPLSRHAVNRGPVAGVMGMGGVCVCVCVWGGGCGLAGPTPKTSRMLIDLMGVRENSLSKAN